MNIGLQQEVRFFHVLIQLDSNQLECKDLGRTFSIINSSEYNNVIVVTCKKPPKQTEIMENRFIQVVFFLSTALFTRGKLCVQLHPGLFAACVKAGINSTIVFSTSTSNPSKKLVISSLTSQTIIELQRCSPYVDFLICSVSVPKCIEGVHSPVLPCKRVCEDIVRGCDFNRIHNGDVEWLKGLCRILPGESSNHTKCIEPRGFQPIHQIVPIQKSCTKLFIPQCQGFGFNYTTKSFIEQLYLSRHFDSILNETVISSTSTHCMSLVQEFLCTELIPPCFEDDLSEPAIYTVCKERCKVLWSECPTVLTRQFGIFEDCSMDAEQETDYPGFCRVNQWPGTYKWVKAKYDIAQLIKKTNNIQDAEVHTLALSITFSVVLACAILASIAYCHIKRRRVFNLRGYWRHGDEEEDEMTVIMTT